jgi:hypothetical protein
MKLRLINATWDCGWSERWKGGVLLLDLDEVVGDPGIVIVAKIVRVVGV